MAAAPRATAAYAARTTRGVPGRSSPAERWTVTAAWVAMPGMYHASRDLLEPAGHGWLLGVHDLIVAWNLLSLGRLEDAEPVARSSLERFDAAGEVLLVVSPLNALASIAEIRGDLDAAAAAYEVLLARCRATGQPLQVPFSLVALATLRARQGDDGTADIADPTRDHTEAFTALALRRARGLAYRSLTDEPDVAALTARLALPAR